MTFAADIPGVGVDGSRRMYLFLMLLTMLAATGFQGWSTLINNFAVEVAHIDGQQMGLVQSLREVPSFLALLVNYLLLVFQEHRLAVFSVITLGLGIALTGIPTRPQGYRLIHRGGLYHQPYRRGFYSCHRRPVVDGGL